MMNETVRTFFMTAALSIAALFTGCGTMSSSEINVTEKESGKTIQAAVGDTVTVSLEANPSTGYLWVSGGLPNDNILRQTDVRYIRPENQKKNICGAPARKVLKYLVVGPGQTGISMVYKRPWEQGVAPVKSFELLIKASGESMIPKTESVPEPVRRGSDGKIYPKMK